MYITEWNALKRKVMDRLPDGAEVCCPHVKEAFSDFSLCVKDTGERYIKNSDPDYKD